MPAGGVNNDDRVLTIPNAVTAVRLGLIPVFVWLLVHYGAHGRVAAALLLGGLGATDWIDGYLARRLGQVSTVGKVLDPLADRLLLVVATVSIIVISAVPLWVAVVALAREAFVATGFVIVAKRGGRRMEVQLVGKAATLAMMFALPLFLAGHAPTGWHQVAEDLAWVGAVPGLVLGWYSALGYIPMGRAAMAAGRQDRNLHGQEIPT